MKFLPSIFFAAGATGVASFVAAVGCSSDEVWKSREHVLGPFTEGLIQNQGSFPSWSINLYLLQFWGSVVRYGLVLGLLNFCFFNLRVSSFLISQTTSATWIF